MTGLTATRQRRWPYALMRRVDHGVTSHVQSGANGLSDGLSIPERVRPLLDGFDAHREDFAVFL